MTVSTVTSILYSHQQCKRITTSPYPYHHGFFFKVAILMCEVTFEQLKYIHVLPLQTHINALKMCFGIYTCVSYKRLFNFIPG